MDSPLVNIGNVIFNPSTVILATRGDDGSLLVNLPDRNEHVFQGQDAVLAWAAIMPYCGIVKQFNSQPLQPV